MKGLLFDLIAALALVLFIEGLLYAAIPTTMKAVMRQVLSTPANRLRLAGLVAAVVGLFVLWQVRGG